MQRRPMYWAKYIFDLMNIDPRSWTQSAILEVPEAEARTTGGANRWNGTQRNFSFSRDQVDSGL